MKLSQIIIDTDKKRFTFGIKDLFQYKDLFLVLAYRDFRVRYAQTFLGFAWAFVQPLITLIILNIIFSRFAEVETGGVPHLLFTICGTSAWTYFAFVMTNSGNSIIGSQDMVKKIYFPRLIIPLSKAVVGLIDFFITFSIIIILMIYYRYPPSANLIFLPLFVLMTVLAALGVGIWLSALTIRYRDFQHIVPFMVQIGLYITPVAYPAEFAINKLPRWLSVIYFMNPMAGVVQGFRWSILGGTPPNGLSYISFVFVIILFASGLIYFKKVEKVMADII